MAKQQQLRKGTTIEHSTFTGADSELTVDTTTNELVLHDGITAGGISRFSPGVTIPTIPIVDQYSKSSGYESGAIFRIAEIPQVPVGYDRLHISIDIYHEALNSAEFVPTYTVYIEDVNFIDQYSTFDSTVLSSNSGYTVNLWLHPLEVLDYATTIKKFSATVALPLGVCNNLQLNYTTAELDLLQVSTGTVDKLAIFVIPTNGTLVSDRTAHNFYYSMSYYFSKD